MDRLDDDMVLDAVVATRDLDKECINCIVWMMLVCSFCFVWKWRRRNGGEAGKKKRRNSSF